MYSLCSVSLWLAVLALRGRAMNNGADPALQQYTISASGINATFIPYGGRITNLFVADKQGYPRDVVVGYDNPASYPKDTATNRTYFGAYVGPYANRIKNGTFSIDGQTYQVDRNEHGGLNTLHGGKTGYDSRVWNVTQANTSTITFGLYDAAGISGFPGAVQNYITYTVLGSPARLVTRGVSISLSHKTPIMPSTHIYWNLGAFTTPTVLNDTLQMPRARRLIVGDTLLVPTGEIRTFGPNDPLNFTYPKPIGDGALHATDCGLGCTGIDNAFILDYPKAGEDDSQLIWSSPDTGIRMRLSTNKPSLQIYACAGQNGTIPLKASQSKGRSTGYLEKNGCVVIEPQGWIDGINQPEWGQYDSQMLGPQDGPFELWAQYIFDTI